MTSAERRARVEALFQAACDLGERERASFLERECAHELDLKREVESLLEQLDGEEAFFESPLFPDTAGRASSPAPERNIF